MSSTLKINGVAVLVNNDLTNQGVLTTTVNLTSSNNITNTLTVNNSTWTAIDSGSAANLRYLFLSNPNTGSSVLICENTSVIQYKTILNVGDTALVPYSGSVNLYAKTVGSDSPAYLQYIYVQA